jgi:hypothetical protein
VIWREVAAIARSLPGLTMDDLADVAGRLFELHERSAGAAVDGYRDEAREMLKTSERERAVLVDVILAGTASSGSLWHAAQTLELSLGGFFLMVVAESPQPGQDPLPRVESALAVQDVGSVWRLEATRSLGVMTVLGSPVDLSQLKVDSYLVAGSADHITPCQNRYRSTALLGGDTPVRAVHQRAHRRPGQPPDQPEGQLPDRQHRARPRSRHLHLREVRKSPFPKPWRKPPSTRTSAAPWAPATSASPTSSPRQSWTSGAAPGISSMTRCSR